jgi:hypothetical protein
MQPWRSLMFLRCFRAAKKLILLDSLTIEDGLV